MGVRGSSDGGRSWGSGITQAMVEDADPGQITRVIRCQGWGRGPHIADKILVKRGLLEDMPKDRAQLGSEESLSPLPKYKYFSNLIYVLLDFSLSLLMWRWVLIYF